MTGEDAVSEENWQLVEGDTGRVVVSRLEVARSLWQRSVGLLGRASLDKHSALWLEPCGGIHTLGMRFPIDVLFLDREGNVLKTVSNLRPWRFCGPVRDPPPPAR